MGTESKGRAWFGKIYNKLETILVEVDTFTSQNTLCLKSSDPSDWESVRSEPEEVAEDRFFGTCDLPSCESPSEPPSVQNFDISGYVRVEERVQGDSLNENSSATSLPDGEILAGVPLLQEYCNGNLTSATTLGDEEPIITDEESQITNTLTPQKCPAGEPSIFPGEESVEEDRVESYRDDVSIDSHSTEISVGSFETVVDSESTQSSTDDSDLNPIATKILDIHVQDNVAIMRSSNDDGNLDAVINGKSDISPLDSKALHSMEVREDPSFVDDNALYAVRLRTKKLRSVKRKILDALTSKRRREKDYEELSIWFGDADMGSDLATGKDSKHSKSSQVHEPEDSPWELL